MATDSVTVSPTYNGDSVPLTAGMIVRLKPGANNNVVRAQADTAPHAQGVNGVVISGASAPTTGCVVVCTGKETVQMESGLTLAVGQTVYVSPNVAGKGTNVLPAVVVPIGTIADVSAYASSGTVEVDVVVNAGSSAGGGGAFPGYGTPGSIGPNEPTTGTSALVLRADSLPGQKIEAQWPIANVRWYAVDGTNGNDANAGFSDTSSADAGTKAKKTLAGLAALFPRVGAGRKAVIMLAQGTYTDNLDVFLQGCIGYAANFPLVVGTGTNSTAGAIAFAGDANDRTYVGAVTATGANPGGYNPIGSPSVTSIQCANVGGGTPGFGAEPALPLGVRVRFDIATTTPALRNLCVAVIGVATTSTPGDTLLLPAPATGAGGLPTAPALTDTFYVEMPGVNTGTFQCALGPQAPGPGAISTNQVCPTFVGLNVGVQTRIEGGRALWAFCRHAFITSLTNADLLQTSFSYHDEAAVRIVGPVRSDGQVGTTGPAALNGNNGNGSLFCAGVVSYSSAESGLFSNGSYAGAGMAVFSCSGSLDDPNNQPSFQIGARVVNSQSTARIVGAATAEAKTAGLAVQTSNLTVGRLSIAPGAFPAIALVGLCGLGVSNQLTGNTGTDVGLDLTAAKGSTIVIFSAPTVTGSLGDVRLSDGTIISWATAMAGVVDTAGNILQGPATSPLHPTAVAAGAVTVAITNAPAGSGAAPARYFKMPDGAGGFYTIASLT